MTLAEAFSILGIPVTEDSLIIKQAYQKQIVLHHPEEDPQGFMLLHEAYKTALSHAVVQVQVIYTGSCEEPAVSREDHPYDRLFDRLLQDRTERPPCLTQDFRKQLRRLQRHWMPVPLQKWQQFFSSEAFFSCRNQEECLEYLLDVILGKIHTYTVCQFLYRQLWELEDWLRYNDEEFLAHKTKLCIELLQMQYVHFQKLNSESQISTRLCLICWYYQALPFYFRLMISAFLFPVFSFGSMEVLIWLLIFFYSSEFFIWLRIASRKMGCYYPSDYRKKNPFRPTSRGDSGLWIMTTIFTILLHLAACTAVLEAIIR